MNWEVFWDKVAKSSDSEIDQVQRKDISSIDITAKNIISILDLKDTDLVLDVCCGNGLLTNIISSYCKEVRGIDLSKELLKTGSKYEHIQFVKGNATSLSEHFADHVFDKIYLQFSFQYFDKEEDGRKVIQEMLKVLKPEGKIFIGDIPNYDKRWKYYNSLAKRFFYITSKWRGTNRMGKFWKKESLDRICLQEGIKGAYIEQSKGQPYSHYRFDYLISSTDTLM